MRVHTRMTEQEVVDKIANTIRPLDKSARVVPVQRNSVGDHSNLYNLTVLVISESGTDKVSIELKRLEYEMEETIKWSGSFVDYKNNNLEIEYNTVEAKVLAPKKRGD